MELVDNIDQLKDTLVYQRFISRTAYWEESILSENKPLNYIKSKDINANPDDYILCFSSHGVPNFLDIIPKEGIYI